MKVVIRIRHLWIQPEIFSRNMGISSFPTTFMIDREGNVFGYVEWRSE